MGKAIFTMSNQLLCDLLNLPEGTTVRSVFRLDDSPRGYNAPMFGVSVEHSDIPDKYPKLEIMPVFRRITSSAVEFEDWGLE